MGAVLSELERRSRRPGWGRHGRDPAHNVESPRLVRSPQTLTLRDPSRVPRREQAALTGEQVLSLAVRMHVPHQRAWFDSQLQLLLPARGATVMAQVSGFTLPTWGPGSSSCIELWPCASSWPLQASEK